MTFTRLRATRYSRLGYLIQILPLVLLIVVAACDDDEEEIPDAAAADEAESDSEAVGESDSGAPDAGITDDSALAVDCTRDGLTRLIDGYFAALAAHDPSSLPVASEVRYTENGEVLALGQGFWQTAGELEFHRNILDPETCGAVVQAVVGEQGARVILGLRLKLEAQQITEVESIIAREGIGAFVPFYPEVIMETPQPEWEQPVPLSERSTRERLIEIADLYFDGFTTARTPEYKPVPFAQECHRWENGLMTTKDTGGCVTTFDNITGSPIAAITHRRYPVIDVENGVSVGFVNFANLWVDFHMFKVSGDEIRIMHAVLSSFESTGASTGWEDRETKKK